VLVKKLLAKFVRLETLVVYSCDLRMHEHKLSAANPAINIIRIDEPRHEDFIRLCHKHPERGFPARLQLEGQQCIVAMHNNHIAGYAWVAGKDLYVDEIACTYTVAKDEVFIYDCFVEPEHRGAGIYPAMLAFILDDSRHRAHLKTASIAAVAVNRASIRGILKAGFTEQRRIRYVEYRRKQLWWGIDPLGQA
jgi:GNAT superfamily N-acetyltransferase